MSNADRWPVHTVVFDLDDTLFAERDYVLSGFRAVDEWIRRERRVEASLLKPSGASNRESGVKYSTKHSRRWAWPSMQRWWES